MGNLFFTSDLHFGHANIIEHCGRPFGSVQEMDDALIDNWNNTVHPGDDVWVLGDFTFRNFQQTQDILSQLEGNKKLILGNHDKVIVENRDKFLSRSLFQEIADLKMIHGPGKQRIVLCHYAMRVWNQSHRGSWQLYGHSHGNLLDDPFLLSMDVGVDACEYRPISFDEVKAHMETKVVDGRE